MNRRLFLTSGISMMAVSRMARGLEDSPFFKGTIPDARIQPCPRTRGRVKVKRLREN
jgi:hypothetical protein